MVGIIFFSWVINKVLVHDTYPPDLPYIYLVPNNYIVMKSNICKLLSLNIFLATPKPTKISSKQK